MNSELAIKIDYLKKRQNPAQVFEAMGLYINAYKDFCQLLVNSVDLQVEFAFQLEDVEKGSIISKLSSFGSGVGKYFESVLFNSGETLCDVLMGVAETESEEDVNAIAAALEENVSSKISSGIVEPHIDRQGLAKVLKEFSDANRKLKPGEKVLLAAANSELPSSFNVEWRFLGDPQKMFLGSTKHFEGQDKLYAMVQVNEGNSVWTFKSPAMQHKFPAKITDKDWLQRYQTGLVRPIGPLDLMEVELSYVIYSPPEGKGRTQIRNAKIKKIIHIHRNRDYQNVFDI